MDKKTLIVSKIIVFISLINVTNAKSGIRGLISYGLSGGTIAGIVIGCLVALCCIAGLVSFLWAKYNKADAAVQPMSHLQTGIHTAAKTSAFVINTMMSFGETSLDDD